MYIGAFKKGKGGRIPGRFRGINDLKPTTKPATTTTEAPGIMNRIAGWFRDEDTEERNPAGWPGENGKAVQVPAVRKDEAKRRFKENQFNIVASDMVALNRSLPDQRSAK